MIIMDRGGGRKKEEDLLYFEQARGEFNVETGKGKREMFLRLRYFNRQGRGGNRTLPLKEKKKK